MEEKIVKMTYALTESDILHDELGEFEYMPLSKAIRLAKKMLNGAYIQVTIRKV